MVGPGAELVDGVDTLLADGAQVGPVVAEVEDIDKLFAGFEPAQCRLVPIEGAVRLFTVPPAQRAGPGLISEGEQVQMVTVSAGERVVDGVGEAAERVVSRDGEEAPRPWPIVLAMAGDQIDPH
jgi:hypothetical protein